MLGVVPPWHPPDFQETGHDVQVLRGGPARTGGCVPFQGGSVPFPGPCQPMGRQLCSPGLGCATGCGGEERLTAPLFAWLVTGSCLHSTSDLVPARSLQTARGAHWSPVPCGSRPLLWAQSTRECPFQKAVNPKPGAGAPKAPLPARAVPRCTSKCLWLREVGGCRAGG